MFLLTNYKNQQSQSYPVEIQFQINGKHKCITRCSVEAAEYQWQHPNRTMLLTKERPIFGICQHACKFQKCLAITSQLQWVIIAKQVFLKKSKPAAIFRV